MKKHSSKRATKGKIAYRTPSVFLHKKTMENEKRKMRKNQQIKKHGKN